MLKINLLPPYVFEGSKVRTAFVIWCVLVVLAAAGVSWLRYSVDQQGASWASQADAIQAQAKQAVDYTDQTAKVKSDSAALMAKVDFVRSARTFDLTTYPPVVANVIDYTISNVLYSALTPQGNTISMVAYAPTLSDVADYVMWMEHDPEISNVSIRLGQNSDPGFPTPEGWNESEQWAKQHPGQGGHTFDVVLTLVHPIPAAGPAYGVAAAAGGAGGMGLGAPGSLMPGRGAVAPGAGGQIPLHFGRRSE